jgi:hypothetical protein
VLGQTPFRVQGPYPRSPFTAPSSSPLRSGRQDGDGPEACATVSQHNSIVAGHEMLKPKSRQLLIGPDGPRMVKVQSRGRGSDVLLRDRARVAAQEEAPASVLQGEVVRGVTGRGDDLEGIDPFSLLKDPVGRSAFGEPRGCNSPRTLPPGPMGRSSGNYAVPRQLRVRGAVHRSDASPFRGNPRERRSDNRVSDRNHGIFGAVCRPP